MGTIRVSIVVNSDYPTRVIEHQWEAEKEYLNSLDRWIAGAVLRKDSAPDGVSPGSLPVRSGLSRLIDREE